jgi:hypothetical protein
MAGLLNIFRSQSGTDTGRNGNSASQDNKSDLAARFLEHVIGALDLLDEARRRQEAAPESGAEEMDADKKTN